MFFSSNWKLINALPALRQTPAELVACCRTAVLALSVLCFLVLLLALCFLVLLLAAAADGLG
jgi:hypothetical protein